MRKLAFALAIILLLLVACKPRPVVEPQQQALPAPAAQQQPAAAPTTPPAARQPAAVPAQQQQMTSTISPAVVLTGDWAGSLTFTNNCPNPACRYKGRMNPPSITMQLQQNGNNVAGAITVNFANFEIEELLQGLPCGTFQQMVQQGAQSQSPIQNGVISSSRLTFTDVGGNNWDLRVTSDQIQGTISNNEPGCMGIQSSTVALTRQR